jgi:hypothetical protein
MTIPDQYRYPCSLLEGVPLLSRDRVFESMKVPIIW